MACAGSNNARWVNIYRLVSAPNIVMVMPHKSEAEAIARQHVRNDDLRWVATKLLEWDEDGSAKMQTVRPPPLGS